MINEKMLISYLKNKKKECEECVDVLQEELSSSLIYNSKQRYLVKKLMCESIKNDIRIYADLIERIKNEEFDVQMAHSLSTDTIPVDYGFHQAEKSVQSLKDLISSISERKYNEDFINEMKRIEKEQSEKLKGDEDIWGT